MQSTANRLSIFDEDRARHITRLEGSMQRWRNDGLDRRHPELYAHYMDVLNGLQDGAAYTIKDITPDIMHSVGKFIHATVMAGDRIIRADRKAKGK